MHQRDIHERVARACRLLILGATVFAVGTGLCRSAPRVLAGGTAAAVDEALLLGRIDVENLAPDPRGGRAYRLQYVVDVPLAVYWRFKTDFDNAFLLDNKFIDEHRLVARLDDAVVTENRYSHSPGEVFRWKTIVDESAGTIDFFLLNPVQCGQRFHYGSIRVAGLGEKTRVVQEGYFDFFGADLWAHYPWAGGMEHFLRYTAHWEQNTVVRLRSRYEK
jgi:hypothetical protein